MKQTKKQKKEHRKEIVAKSVDKSASKEIIRRSFYFYKGDHEKITRVCELSREKRRKEIDGN